jgi:cytochrome oxidase assembly protein ShyY1
VLRVMRRPTSLLLLLLAIVMAVGFSLLGQWQLGRAFENGTAIESEAEDPLPLSSVVTPGVQTPSEAVGQLVTTSGEWSGNDFAVLADRLNDGTSGFWVIGRFVTDDGSDLAVAVGWSETRQDAEAAADAYEGDPDALPGQIEGRYQQSEQPSVDEDAEADALPKEMAVPALINQWGSEDAVYAGYATLIGAPEGLTEIYSPAPERQVQLNFLNLFYTVEWAFFALIALYIWYRHMRDVADREHDEQAAERSGARE